MDAVFKYAITPSSRCSGCRFGVPPARDGVSLTNDRRFLAICTLCREVVTKASFNAADPSFTAGPPPKRSRRQPDWDDVGSSPV